MFPEPTVERNSKNSDFKAERTLMPDLRHARKDIKTALAILGVVDVAAIVSIVFPARGLDRLEAAGDQSAVG